MGIMQNGRERRRLSIVELVRSGMAVTQWDLAKALEERGFQVTQSTVSRDLSELGAIKIDGAYRLPESRAGGSEILELMAVEPVGENLVVLRTPIGQATAVALRIDRAGMDEIVGTVAGDDTIFVAVRNSAQQRRAIKAIVGLFSNRG